MNTSVVTRATASQTAGFVTEIAIAQMVQMKLIVVSVRLISINVWILLHCASSSVGF